MEDHITLLLEGNRIDELSANQREQLAARYEGMLLRLRTLLHKIETDETESDIESSREAELAEVIGPYPFRPGTLGQTSPEVIAVLHDAEASVRSTAAGSLEIWANGAKPPSPRAEARTEASSRPSDFSKRFFSSMSDFAFPLLLC